jgi:GrpB-like predicted nucleotidyltransferase (UPF0157 family)
MQGAESLPNQTFSCTRIIRIFAALSRLEQASSAGRAKISARRGRAIWIKRIRAGFEPRRWTHFVHRSLYIKAGFTTIIHRRRHPRNGSNPARCKGWTWHVLGAPRFSPYRPFLSEHQTQGWNPGLSPPVAPSVQMPYRPQPPVKFLEPEAYQPLARELFHQISAMIRQALPGSRIEHIGSSAIEGAVSKGDLDIFVGVEEFDDAIASIESLGFRIKTESFRNESLCPFESGIYPIPVGIQLVVNRSEFEFFILFRDRMNADANLRSAYNELKRQASGLDEDGYRHTKSEFIESVLRMVSRRPAMFKTTHFTAELLSPADLGLVIQLNSECSDFYFLQNGQSPNEADARELFEQVPTQCDPLIKLPIGLFDPQKTLIGVLDVLRGYRTASDWYIGLMLLSPRFRGQGLGVEIHNEFVAHARQAGVKRSRPEYNA